MKKRIIAVGIFVALSIAVLCVINYFALPSDAAETYLPREEIPLYDGGGLERLGILKGTENGFELERPVTRAEAVVFIMRTLALDTRMMYAHPFDDVRGHWSESFVDSFYNMGYISGTSENAFSPDRTVTGREFTKMLLSAMGYENVTLENAAEKGKEHEVLMDNFTKSVVLGNYELLRSDVLRICHSALTTKFADGTKVYQRWIDKGGYTLDSFEGVLWCGLPAAKSFSGKINGYMPADENYVFSPISIKMALALAANGAEGETEKELLSLMDITSIGDFNKQNRELIEKYAQTDALYLWFANSVWLNETSVPGMNFSEEFLKNAKLYFAADSFKVKEKEAVEKINIWVNKKTNGKIQGITDNSDFDAALINAVYFKANWVNEFEERNNTQEAFHSRDGSTRKITFMNDTGYYAYATVGGTRILELPYNNYEEIFDEEGKYIDSKRYDNLDLGMYILMSENKVADPQKVIEGAVLQQTYIDLTLPKFKIETMSDMKQIMSNLGIEMAFDINAADFTAMVEPGNVYIKDIKHKAVIEVNEKGTEAAAVTAIMAGATSAMRPQPIEFRVDKPFTFVVRDNISGEILFMGEYAFAK